MNIAAPASPRKNDFADFYREPADDDNVVLSTGAGEAPGAATGMASAEDFPEHSGQLIPFPGTVRSTVIGGGFASGEEQEPAPVPTDEELTRLADAHRDQWAAWLEYVEKARQEAGETAPASSAAAATETAADGDPEIASDEPAAAAKAEAEPQPDTDAGTDEPHADAAEPNEPRQERAEAKAERYVSRSKALEEEATSRALEVFSEIGVRWDSASKTINCPFPWHPDHNPSWRWDAHKGRCFCACKGNGWSILNIAQAITGLPYKDMLVYVAEILGRDDLIITSGGKRDGASYQKQTPEALRNIPAANRDDTLVPKYLSARLGIDAAKVPPPATWTRGIRALQYMEPPKRKDGKPKLIATPPAAVFGTADRDGKEHAHRIYTLPDGTGKAELFDDKGDALDAKKSATKASPDENTSGRSVIWGKTETATVALLCEGIETACAVAYAFREEIAKGTMVVAAAISAPGVAGFKPWPAMKTIIVGADRDEEPKEGGKPGSRAGEKAARKFGMQNHKAIEVKIALPGKPGESIDWLDILHRDGVDVVRTGILGAAAFEPTEEDHRSAAKAALPEIEFVGGELPENINAAEAALIQAGVPIFQRGETLVMPAIVDIPGRKQTVIKGVRLIQASAPLLTVLFTKYARWVKPTSKGETAVINCPPMIAESYLSLIGYWKLRKLAGVISAPTLRPDGSILEMPGYDAQTNILYEPAGGRFPRVPANPSKADALAALGVLKSLIREFPFVTNGDKPPVGRAVALSGMLTAPIRRSLDAAPLHAIDAVVPGSGKGMIVEITSMIADGRRVAAMTQGHSPQEFEKTLGAQLLNGDTAICIDNCEMPLGGALLCSALTELTMRVRVLGESKSPEVICNAVFFATGNQLVIEGDMTRRALLCKLDPKCERPEDVEHSFDPIELIRADRAKYVIAALTILRAYHVAGYPQKPKPLGSFEQWSNWVRGALIWLGEADPCDSMAEGRKSDPKRQAHLRLLEEWAAVFGDKRVTVKKVIETACKTERNPADPDSTYLHADLRDALLDVAGDRGMINNRRLGIWLASINGRIIEEKKIELAGTLHGNRLWQLSVLGGLGGSGGSSSYSPREKNKKNDGGETSADSSVYGERQEQEPHFYYSHGRQGETEPPEPPEPPTADGLAAGEELSL
jgi:hypothetical protein